MVAAATRAMNSNNRGDDDNKQFRTIIFVFANVIFLELCHLFVIFLTKGRKMTPTHLPARGPLYSGYTPSDRVETGRYMEAALFGGNLEILDSTRHTDQVRVHHDP